MSPTLGLQPYSYPTLILNPALGHPTSLFPRPRPPPLQVPGLLTLRHEGESVEDFVAAAEDATAVLLRWLNYQIRRYVEGNPQQRDCAPDFQASSHTPSAHTTITHPPPTARHPPTHPPASTSPIRLFCCSIHPHHRRPCACRVAQVTNLHADLSDSAALLIAIHQIAPPGTARSEGTTALRALRVHNRQQRASLMLRAAVEIGVEMFELEPDDVVEASKRPRPMRTPPALERGPSSRPACCSASAHSATDSHVCATSPTGPTGAFVAALLHTCPNLQPSDDAGELRKLRHDGDDDREERAFRAWLSSLGFALAPVRRLDSNRRTASSSGRFDLLELACCPTQQHNRPTC